MSDDQGQIVRLVATAKFQHNTRNRFECFSRVATALFAQCGDQSFLAELLAFVPCCFGNAIGKECESVACVHCDFLDRTLPLRKCAQNAGRCGEMLYGSISLQQDGGIVTTVHVTQPTTCIVILGQNKCDKMLRRSRFKEELVYPAHHGCQIVEASPEMGAHSCLQSRHQQCRGHSLTGNIAENKGQSSRTKIEKVVVVPTNRARLDANPA